MIRSLKVFIVSHSSHIPHQDAPIIPAHDGGFWNDDDWRNWRRRVFQQAAKAHGLDGIRPYDLRHSFVSLLIAEGRSTAEIARQAGHSPTMTLDTYGHVFDELDGGVRRPAEDVIRGARTKVIREVRAPSVHPRGRLDASKGAKSLPYAETS